MRWSLKFADGTVAYTFGSDAEALEFALEFDPRPDVVGRVANQDAAAAQAARLREASAFYSVPCRFTP